MEKNKNKNFLFGSVSSSDFVSLAKGVAATTLATLIDKTDIKYSDKVSKVWPEFGQNGKENVTIEHAVSHRGGMTKAPPVMDIISTYRRYEDQHKLSSMAFTTPLSCARAEDQPSSHL